jgi:hypothetical protein
VKAPLKRSAATEVFYGSADGKLVVVYHIQKTAGTALRHVVRRNLGGAEVELQPGLAELRHERTELLDWYARWYRGLDEERRSRLCCVMSHLAGYLLPALDRPADALVLVREPVDRTLSYWHAKARRREGRKQMPSLEEIYAREPDPAKPERWEQFHNWQSRALLSVFHDVTELPLAAEDPTAADWRAKLRDLVGRVYTVGVQDRFEEFVASLAERYGWTVSTPRSKVNPNRRPASELSAGARERILTANWLDAELYEVVRG